jgi:hypothetical protein
MSGQSRVSVLIPPKNAHHTAGGLENWLQETIDQIERPYGDNQSDTVLSYTATLVGNKEEGYQTAYAFLIHIE